MPSRGKRVAPFLCDSCVRETFGIDEVRVRRRGV